jgi:hypothetical protein
VPIVLRCGYCSKRVPIPEGKDPKKFRKDFSRFPMCDDCVRFYAKKYNNPEYYDLLSLR